MDLDPELTGRHDTHEGLHGTALGGAWMAAVQGFGGIALGEKGLTINPRLPENWRSLSFRIRLHGEVLDLTITQKKIRIAAGHKASLSIKATVAGQTVTLESSGTYSFEY